MEDPFLSFGIFDFSTSANGFDVMIWIILNILLEIEILYSFKT